MKRIVGIITVCILLVAGVGYAQKGQAHMVENGRTVSFDYTLTVNGAVVDASGERGPLTYTHGSGMIISGLERQLVGLKVGDERTIVVSAEEAYGLASPQMVQEVPRAMLTGGEPERGMVIEMRDKEGRIMPGLIIDIREDAFVVDFNHPLAGQELTFKVKIVAIE